MPETKKYYHNLDVDNNKVINPVLNPLTTVQRIAVGTLLGPLDEGYVCFDTTLNQPFFWDGAAWITVSATTTWGSITGNITNQTDLIGYLLTNYYPLSSNPANYIDLADLSGGVGISYNNLTGVITNSLPDQTVVLNSGTGISITGTYPNFTITNTSPSSGGTVTGVTASTPLASSGGTTPNITIQQASGSQAGYLSSTDWTTFNSKIGGSGTTNTVPKFTASGTIGDSSIKDTATNQGVTVQNTVNTSSGFGIGTYINPTINATANGDNLWGLVVDPTLNAGAFTGVSKYGIYVTPNTGSLFRRYSDTPGEGAIFLGNQANISLRSTATGSLGGQDFVLETKWVGWDTIMYVRRDSQYVGIGTTTPAYKLDVAGSFHTTGINVLDNLSGSGTRMVVADSAGQLSTQTIPSGGGGTVTSVQLSAGTGISLSGTNPITTSGTITVTNSAPDQTVSLGTTGSGLSVTGTYPNFTLQNTLPDQTVALTAGTGIGVSGTYPNFTITNTSPSAGGEILRGLASGTDTYTTTITGVTSYTDGDAYLIRFTNGNTSSCTLNINGIGAATLYRNNDGALIGGDIWAGAEMLCVYNSTLNGFQCIGTSPNSLFSYVTNGEASTITKGQAVYAFSGTGDRMVVKLAYNTGDATSAQTVGIVYSSSIGANQKGIIMMQGLLDGLSILPTSTWSDGDPVYLGSIPGSITKTKPYAPNHLVYLGVVTTASNGAAGRMYVKVQNGYELDELHNVQAQSPSLKDTLWYDNTVSPAQWKTASIATILGYTPQVQLNGTGFVKISGTTISYDNSTYLTSAITSLNGLTGATQTFGNDTNVTMVSSGTTHTLTWSGTLADSRIASASTWNAKIGGSGTTNEIAYFTASGTIGSLTTGTYPSLTELSYVKGVTSAIQTQLSNKQQDYVKVMNLLGSTVKFQTLGLTVSNITGSFSLATGGLRLFPVYIDQTTVITGIKWYQVTQGNYTANNYNGVALYSISSGTLTLVASSTNDGTIWSTATSATMGSKAFSSPYTAAAGVYFVGFLFNASAVTTGPAVGIFTNLQGTGVPALDFTNSVKLFGVVNGQTSLPATQAMSGVTGANTQIWCGLY